MSNMEKCYRNKIINIVNVTIFMNIYKENLQPVKFKCMGMFI